MRQTHLNWIHIVGNDDQLGLLALHQGGDSVHTCKQRGENEAQLLLSKLPALIWFILANAQG